MNPAKALYDDRRISFALSIFWMALILSASSIQQKDMPSLAGQYTSLFHIPAYMALGFFIAPLPGRKRSSAAFAIAFCVFFGAFDELYQSTVPGRVASMTDVFYDFLGGALGVFLFRRWGGMR